VIVYQLLYQHASSFPKPSMAKYIRPKFTHDQSSHMRRKEKILKGKIMKIKPKKTLVVVVASIVASKQSSCFVGCAISALGRSCCVEPTLQKLSCSCRSFHLLLFFKVADFPLPFLPFLPCSLGLWHNPFIILHIHYPRSYSCCCMQTKKDHKLVGSLEIPSPF
jgi:hypothetical protein